mgnify:CR=1 FL=1
MSYDYDGIEVDFDAGEFTIIVGGAEYTYSIEEHRDLLVGAAENGVHIEYKGDTGEASKEDMQEYYNNFDEEEDDSFSNW